MAARIRKPVVAKHSNGAVHSNGKASPLHSSPVGTGGAGYSPIQKLPPDLVLRIFSFLDVVSLCRCAQVSKAWHDLALDGSNWQHVDLFDFQMDIVAEVVERLSVRCGGFLHELSLQSCESVQDQAIRTFSRHCHNIDKLNLANCPKLTDQAIKSIAHHCKLLASLNLSSCMGLTDASCGYLANGCPNLEYVDLSYCAVTSGGVSRLVEHCVNLVALLLQYCMEVDDEALRTIGTKCKKLIRLNIQGCKLVSDEGVHAVCSGCPQLERVSISRIDRLTDSSLRKLGRHCPKLHDLEAAGCAHFTDSGFAALASGCPQLCRMDLEECTQITDLTLAKLAASCPLLQRLVLSHCERITDAGIHHIVSSLCSEELQVLELDNCPLITDDALEMLRSCQSLRRVEVFDCQLVSRPGIHKLQRSRKDIKVHAYFPPQTPQRAPQPARRQVVCQCCIIL